MNNWINKQNEGWINKKNKDWIKEYFTEKIQKILWWKDKEITEITDIWIKLFKNSYPNLFKNLNLYEVKSHSELAEILSKELDEANILDIIKDEYVNSNIRLELLEKNKNLINLDLLKSLSWEILIFNEYENWVKTLYSKTEKQTLVVFNNWNIKKWSIEKIEDNNTETIYFFSDWEKINNFWIKKV